MRPEGKGFAGAFTFDFDAEEGIIGDDPANADRPGVLSQGTYGAKVAVPLILDLLAAKGGPAPFFTPARGAGRPRALFLSWPGPPAPSLPCRGDRRGGARGRAPRVHAHVADEPQPR